MSLNKRLLGGISSGPADTAFFNILLYTGDRPTNAGKTGVGFPPDLVWIKGRDQTDFWSVLDSTRGAQMISTDSTNSESSFSDWTFDSDGFTVGSSGQANNNGTSYVSYHWRANGGTTSANSDGSISSVVQTSPLSGFSIVSYTGTGSNATVGHGLSTAPDWILIKNRDRNGYGWLVYHSAIGAEKYLVLNTGAAQTDQASIFNDTEPTSSVFSIGTDTFGNYNGDKYIAYCWHDVSGFSKFGSYTGNGSTSGPSVNIGFQPDFLMIKRAEVGDSWRIFDSARGLGNPQTLFANLNSAEDNESNTVSSFDSDGWTMGSQQGVNDNGDTYIYMAFKIN